MILALPIIKFDTISSVYAITQIDCILRPFICCVKQIKLKNQLSILFCKSANRLHHVAVFLSKTILKHNNHDKTNSLQN